MPSKTNRTGSTTRSGGGARSRKIGPKEAQLRAQREARAQSAASAAPPVEQLPPPTKAEAAGDTGPSSKALTDTLIAEVKKAVAGVKVESSKKGGKRYFRVGGQTAAFVLLGKRHPSVKIGSAAPVAIKDEGAVTKIVPQIVKRAEKMKADQAKAPAK